MKIKLPRFSRVRCFSLIELLVSITIIGILANLLLPAFTKSKEKAKFARWLAFNRQCSNDPTCVLNLNFQDGEGNITNSAQGAAFEGYNTKDYKGVLHGDCEWTTGRFPPAKKAILFPGHYSFVEIHTGNDCELGSRDPYTLNIWVCFDYDNSAGPILSKGLIQYDAPNYFGQLYMNPYPWWDKNRNNFRFYCEAQATGYEARFGQHHIHFTKYPFAKHDWLMLTLRNKIENNKKVVDFFINGEIVGRKNEEIMADTIKIKSSIWLGALKYQRFGSDKPIPDHQQSGFGFKGRMDELIIYRRALPDKEIWGHYEMGRVR